MIALRALTEAQLREIYQRSMRRDFPESELKPLETILKLWRRGVYEALGGYEGEQLAAYAMVYRRRQSRMPLLDYLAVEPEKRGKGAGGEMLRLLRSRYAASHDAIFIECELPSAAPDPREAEGRIQFYRHEGARVTDLCVTLFGVEFCILCLPCGEERVPDDGLADELLSLYRGMMTQTLFAQNVHLHQKR